MQSGGTSHFLRIGTRGSPLALAQAHMVRRLLAEAHGVSEVEIAVVTVSTAGDRSQAANQPLHEIGGKGVFSKEIEDRLLSGEIDLAVHSSKDMATRLPDGLVMDVFLAREDVRDAFLTVTASTLDELPEGAVIGTSSLRRRAQLLQHRPDLKMVEFRGNLGTRMQKLADGIVDATLLAAAGLNRLGQAAQARGYLDPAVFPPAPAQGAIGIELRAGDGRTAEAVAVLNHAETAEVVTAERAMLRVIDGSCRTPIGVFTQRDGASLTMTGELLSPDGRDCFRGEVSGPAEAAEALGTDLGKRLLDAAGADFIARLKDGT